MLPTSYHLNISVISINDLLIFIKWLLFLFRNNLYLLPTVEIWVQIVINNIHYGIKAR